MNKPSWEVVIITSSTSNIPSSAAGIFLVYNIIGIHVLDLHQEVASVARIENMCFEDVHYSYSHAS